MNREISSLLDAIRARFDEAAQKCSNCGCEMSAEEAMEYGDGKMLCEACWGEMKGESVESDDADTFTYHEWVDGEGFVLCEEKGPIIATVPSKSDPEKTYEIRMGKDGNMYCSCPAWKYQKKSPKDRTCKHIDALNKAIKSQMKLNAESVIDLGSELLVLECDLSDLEAVLEEAKKPKLGSGKRFKALVKSLKGREDVEDPEALAAWLGRKKYGAKFNKMAASGRKRARKARK